MVEQDCLIEFIHGYVGDYLPDPHYTTLLLRVGGLIDSNGRLKDENRSLREQISDREEYIGDLMIHIAKNVL